MNAMLSCRVASRHASTFIRPSRVASTSIPRIPGCQFIRSQSTTTSTPKTQKRFLYPAKLLVYHAGTGRTVFVGFMKITTIAMFTFFTVVVAPIYFHSDEQPRWIAPAVTLSGLVPMVFVAYTTRPFVPFVHLLLPKFARQSRELMIRYVRALPKDADLEITTMSFFGRSVSNRIKIGELYPSTERFGLVNYLRDTTRINKSRSWWMAKAVNKFGIHGGMGRVKEGGVWEILQKRIEKRQ